MWPDQVSNPGPLTYESGALPTALHGPASRYGSQIRVGMICLKALSSISQWTVLVCIFMHKGHKDRLIGPKYIFSLGYFFSFLLRSLL